MSKIRLSIAPTCFKILILFFFLSSCSLWPLAEKRTEIKPVEKSPPSQQQLIYDNAKDLLNSSQFQEAERLYFQITRYPPDNKDIVYDKSLLDLAFLYEKTDQSEKAILALDELSKRDTSVIDKASIKILLIKNHYRVTNYYQARTIRAELDDMYRTQEVSLQDIYAGLYYQTTLYYDRHIFDELLFLGDMQKYFVYVMESQANATEGEKLTELLMLYYDRFNSQLESSALSKEFKKRLIISLIDQLNKFDRYKINDANKNIKYINRFSEFAEVIEKRLTERLTNGNY
jgi:hypothetical protein